MTKRSSGTFIIRIPPEDHESLKGQARQRGISLNQLCQERLNPKIPQKGVGGPWGNFLSACIEQWSAPAFGVMGIILFGSAARGELRADSDIDLLLILDPNTKPSRDHYRSWAEWEHSKRFQQFKPTQHEVAPQFVSLPVDPMEAGGLWYETAIDGVILWEKSDQVSNFLRAIREEMAKGHIQRAFSYGHPYWIKKKAG